jgi:hypothetical protein
MDEEIPEERPIFLHLNYGDSAEDVEIVVSELSDEQLRALWDNFKLQEARLELRERTGHDPAVHLFNYTSEDIDWYINWLERNPEKRKEINEKNA